MIKEIINDEKSLVTPLLKTKVLATRIKNENLLNWVNKEIKGYNNDESIPIYRIGKGNSSCTINYGHGVYDYNEPVPISYITNEQLKKSFYEFEFRESVKTLESYTNSKSDKEKIGIEYSIGFGYSVTNEMKRKGFKAQLSSIKRFTHVSNVTQALTEIREKFLDLMLALEAENLNIADDFSVLDNQDKEQMGKKINVYMNNNYITNSGDGSTINTGANSQINSSAGDNNQQTINFNEKLVDDLKNLINQIIQVTSKLDISKENEEDIQAETKRMETQLDRENPKLNIIGQSLQNVHDILLSIAANHLTNPVMQGIQNMLLSLGF